MRYILNVFTACLGILILSYHHAATAQSSLPTVDDYLADYELRDIAMSMDGSKIAFIQRHVSGSYALIVADINQNFKILTTIFEDSKKKITGVRWLSDTKLAVTLTSFKKIYGVQVGFRRLMVIDPYGQGGVWLMHNTRELRDNFDLSQVASILPYDPAHILVYAYDSSPCLYKVNIITGEAEKYLKGKKNTVFWGLSDRGEPQIRIDFSRRSKKVKIYAFDATKKKWNRIREFRLSEMEEELDKDIAGLKGDAEILVLDRKENDNYISLYKYDLRSKMLTDRVVAVDGYDIESTVTDANTNEIIGVSYLADRKRYIFLDKGIQKIQETLESRFPNGVVEIVSISYDNRRFLFYSNSPWDPGVYYVYDQVSKKVHKISELQPKITRSLLTSVDVVKYASFDGRKIDGYLTFPKRSENSLRYLPLIVNPHGGPQARDWLTFDIYAQYWASRGYVVFQPNYRGSSGYGKAFEEAGYHQYGDAMIEDIASGISALLKSGYADPNRVCAVGMSYGGTASLMLAAKTDLVKCAASINGPTDWVDRVKNAMKEVDKQDREELREWYDKSLGNIDTQKDLLVAHSPITYAKEMDVPILLIHATDDANVNVNQSKDMNRALKKAKKDVKYIELKEGGHTLWTNDALKKTLLETEAFFKKHLH